MQCAHDLHDLGIQPLGYELVDVDTGRTTVHTALGLGYLRNSPPVCLVKGCSTLTAQNYKDSDSSDRLPVVGTQRSSYARGLGWLTARLLPALGEGRRF